MSNDFNAAKAREILDSGANSELETTLKSIEKAAQGGSDVLHIYHSLKHKTKLMLIEKGFKVTDQPSIAIQKDGLYYSIYW